MKNVTLVNPGPGKGFGGAYLDIWSGYNLVYATFLENNGEREIEMVDNEGRMYRSSNLTEQESKEIYFQLIRRGWKIIN